jgi:hypothetical protein
VRVFCNHSKSVEAQLYVRPFVVVEQPARPKHYLLASRPQTYTVRTADVRTDLDKCLMNIAAVFVDLRPRAAVPAVLVVKFELGK